MIVPDLSLSRLSYRQSNLWHDVVFNVSEKDITKAVLRGFNPKGQESCSLSVSQFVQVYIKTDAGAKFICAKSFKIGYSKLWCTINTLN